MLRKALIQTAVLAAMVAAQVTWAGAQDPPPAEPQPCDNEGAIWCSDCNHVPPSDWVASEWECTNGVWEFSAAYLGPDPAHCEEFVYDCLDD